MAKYKFIKIEDEPFSDPLYLKEGPFMGKSKTYEKGGNHHNHKIPGMTEEQDDALKYVIVKKGITLDQLLNSKSYKNALPSEKEGIINVFTQYTVNGRGDRITKYYYSKALYDMFPETNMGTGENLKYGVFLILNKDFVFPITRYSKNPIEYNQQWLDNLVNMFCKSDVGGIQDDTSYIKSAAKNAETIIVSQPVSRQKAFKKGKDVTENLNIEANDIYVTKEYFEKVNQLSKLTIKFNLNIINKLSINYQKLSQIMESLKNRKLLLGINGLEFGKLIKSFKDYINNYPNALPSAWQDIINTYK